MNVDPIGLSSYQQLVNQQAVGAAQGTSAQGVSSQPAGANFSFKLPEHINPSAITNQAPVSSEIAEPTSWGQMLQRMALDVNDAQATAGEKVRDVLAGGATSTHEAMIAVQESSVRFQMLAEVRNKMLDAYQEVMRMQV